MFKSLNNADKEVLSYSGRSFVSETLQIEGDVRSSGSVDVAGLINGNVYVSDMILTETGSVRGIIEVLRIEINGHIEGRITADTVIVGKDAVIKGDIFFRNTLKTEEGADIDGYIKRIDKGKINTEEDIDIEEIVQKVERKPRLVASRQKEAI